MKIFGWVCLVLLGVFLLGIIGVGCGILGAGCNWVSRASQVVKQEVDPAVLLAKYSWFKDASAALDKKQADLRAYDARLAALGKSYGPDRARWTREDREQANVWLSEKLGVQASYNSLAAEYNAAMAKINWAFTNVGSLPQGASQPLPREFKPYAEN